MSTPFLLQDHYNKQEPQFWDANDIQNDMYAEVKLASVGGMVGWSRSYPYQKIDCPTWALQVQSRVEITCSSHVII